MSLAVSSSPKKWMSNCVRVLNSFICYLVFIIFDLLDAVLCIIYRYLDERIEGVTSPCCCSKWERQEKKIMMNDEDDDISDSLYERKSMFRKMGLLQFGRKREDSNGKCGGRKVNCWSDCGCESCLSWVNGSDDDYKLHFVVKEPLLATSENCRGDPYENVIFLHGFMCSSSFWTETVFPCFSENVNHNYRLIAIDLLGFGKSPKPRDCLYTLKDHVEMIEKSVLQPLHLGTFHLVAHSMGSVIALALAAKYHNCVKSITLVAPPYSSFEGNDACLNALEKFAGKKLWPMLSAGSSFMSWDLNFLITDMTRHTHQSAWRSMHNVICGGAKFMDSYLKILTKSRVRINVIQGDKDQVVPRECISKFKLKAPHAEINIIPNADHSTVLLGREKKFAQNLEHTWASC
ncbi:unnamed protein product [Trifolium pratense]|uniref:Uncharacterized protein n=1 Tax=Trifolium pratense TaxID=57577 RepID=A0ACB0LXW8_TRIPR|nr:unnamed protein product [Trifolium pratense]